MHAISVWDYKAVFASILLLITAVPLAMRKVPLNPFYGFRVPKTRSSERIWYDANQVAGINMIVASCVTLAVWGVLCMAGGVDRANAVSMRVMMVPQLVGLVVSCVQLSRM